MIGRTTNQLTIVAVALLSMYPTMVAGDHDSGEGSVLCPGFPDAAYCDCSSDCLYRPDFCSCGEAENCCNLFLGYTKPPGVGYLYNDTDTADEFDWNITLTEEDELSIMRPEIIQGIYYMTTTYILDDRHYTVAIYKWDGETMSCDELPTPQFVIPFGPVDNNVVDKVNTAQMLFAYDQGLIQSSDIWRSYADKSGGEANFCIKVTNYLPDENEPFANEINFHETYYKIVVDSLTDFNSTISIIRTGSDNFTDFINYEDEIEAYTCDEDCDPIDNIYSQGDFVNICVKTEDGSKFAVNSIKELTVSQEGGFSYPYISNFLDGPLSETECKMSNTTDATCKSKLQLLALWFEEDVMSATDYILDVAGAVKLDYVGRRLLEEGKITEHQARKLEETDMDFDLKIEVDRNAIGASQSGALSKSSITAAAAAILGGAALALV